MSFQTKKIENSNTTKHELSPQVKAAYSVDNIQFALKIAGIAATIIAIVGLFACTGQYTGDANLINFHNLTSGFLTDAGLIATTSSVGALGIGLLLGRGIYCSKRKLDREFYKGAKVLFELNQSARNAGYKSDQLSEYYKKVSEDLSSAEPEVKKQASKNMKEIIRDKHKAEEYRKKYEKRCNKCPKNDKRLHACYRGQISALEKISIAYNPATQTNK